MKFYSDVDVPDLDEPITEKEIKIVWKSMKKPGFD